MNKLRKEVAEIIALDVSIPQRLEIIFDFVNNFSYTKEEAGQVMLFGRFLKKMGEIIEDKLKDDVLEYVKKNERFENEDGMISLVSSEQYTYLDDKMLQTYEEEYEKVNKKLKSLRQSIKNRKETLVQEGLALKDTPKQTIRINI